MNEPPASIARQRAGLSRLQAARLLGISPGTIARLERCGSWSYVLAEKARRIYGCSLGCFSKSAREEGETGSRIGRRPNKDKKPPVG